MGINDRTKLLLSNNFEKLSKLKIAVIGVGGVGSVIPISFVRSNIKDIIIVDKDIVDDSNLNRQIAYNINDIGKTKVIALKEHLLELNYDLNIKPISKRIDKEFDFSIFDDRDYIVDCIDDIDAKVLLAKYAIDHNIKYITSLGMGNRLDSTKVEITKLNKTTNDPLAKKFRYNLKKEGVDISKIKVSFSKEQPLIKGKVISSMIFTPNASGLALASHVLIELLGMEDLDNALTKN